ncbi:energy transducer TonB [Marinobacter fuscus]|uniref:Energy transducer TonB n=1 Tax=Marinobacter fuscus TaxID=2109942 RepID=A0A2T1KKT8_9GAMM|nr:TonB family protein [Marinobacter fuscus]PSF10638.1 energy transducer TonB [Marinobacter fuscus]
MPVSDLPSASAPAGYRLWLALSVALVVHTLALAGLPAFTAHQEVSRPRVEIMLASLSRPPAPVSPGSTPVPDKAQLASTPSQQRTDSKSKALPEPVAKTQTPETSARKQAPEPDRQRTSYASPAAPNTPSSTGASPAAQQNPSLHRRELEQNTKNQVSKSPSETDPYLIKLASHLAQQLEHQRIPAVSQLGSTVTMGIELRLMPNGALTRARVVSSSGVQVIDETVYRTALAASPYPKPDNQDSDRFEVKLIFTPPPW